MPSGQSGGMTRHESFANAFTGTDRRRLLRSLAAAGLAREYRRVEAVLLVAEGRSLGEAARQVHVARTSVHRWVRQYLATRDPAALQDQPRAGRPRVARSEEHTSELQSRGHLVCRLLLE